MNYTIEETNLERQHLLAQFLDPLSLNALEPIYLPRGSKILDVGCGLGGDALQLPFSDASFGLVFTRYLLHHLSDFQAALAEMKRVCRTGGIVFAQEPGINSIKSIPGYRYRVLILLAGVMNFFGNIGAFSLAVLFGKMADVTENFLACPA